LVRLAASANEVVPTGRLIEDLWDGAPPPGAASTLQSHVSVLRGLIGSDRIRFVDGGYMLTLHRGECDLASSDDLGEARRAEQAGDLDRAAGLLEQWLARWRGGALADVAGASWATGEVTRLEELRAGAVERWLGVRLGLGDHISVVADAELAVSEFPLREGLWAALMLALYRSGRQSDALRTFRRLGTLLAEELGIEPSPELRTLEEAMLLQKAELEWQPPARQAGAAGQKELPSGTVTFLAAQIEHSTALAEHIGDDAFARLVEEHHRIVREAIATHHGVELSAETTGFLVVFADAGLALATATDIQVAHLRLREGTELPVRIAMGLHTGSGRRVGDTFVGLAVHQTSLLCRASHGGQIVVTQPTRDAAGGLTNGMWWQALGRHRLEGLSEPLELHQLCHPSLDDTFEPLRSVGALTHRLPVQASSFLGRVDDLALGATLLGTTRLLSVVGPGGAGKTRMAYQLAASQVGQFPDGVWVVELASEVDPKRLPALLLSALGRRNEPGRSTTETIISCVQDRRSLVVLDNCEHVVDAAGSLINDLLGACARLRVLVTSREPLRIAGESVWRLGPLQLPDAKETDLGVVAGADAVALFCERAEAAHAGFILDADNAAMVTAICRRVEGMPLAIELAAAWVRTLPLKEIVERLDDALDLLTKGPRHGADRHSSLRATLTWSHDLLTPTEDVLFRRLAVFAGGFTLAAAEHVAAGEGLDRTEILDALDGLVDKSLVRLGIDQADQGRYWLLETVRAYAYEHLRGAADELDTHIERHGAFYCQLAADCAAAGWTGAARDRLEADHPNLLGTLEHVASTDQVTEHGRLLLDLAQFWDLGGYMRLGEREFRRYLARDDRDGALDAVCCRRLAVFASHLGDYAEAEIRYGQALAEARQRGDHREEAQDLAGLAQVAWYVADYAESGTHYEAALAIARDMGDRQMEGKWLGNLGMVARELGHYAEARSNYQGALSVAREWGDRVSEGALLGSLGVLAFDMGDDQEALARYEEALSMFRDVGDRFREGGFVGNIGRVSLRLGDYGEAHARFEEALAIARDIADRQSEGYWTGCLGQVASRVGDPGAARRFCHDALAIAQEVGDRRSQRDWLGELGVIACTLGDHAAARRHLGQALAIARDVGRPDDALLEACAGLLVSLERYDDAAELLGAADAITAQAQRGALTSAHSSGSLSLERCRTQLSQQAFARAYDRGQVGDWEGVSARAMELLGAG
jgi:predicted ATPase/class 3 adenylate cyclase